MFYAIFLLVSLFLFSLPERGAIIHGSAAFSKLSQTELEIVVSDQTLLDWDSFSIGEGERTRFVLPHDKASVINRVVGSEASLIQGVLESGGRVFLLNPNGLLIGKTGVIDTASFVASTLPLAPWGDGRGGRPIENAGKVKALTGDLCLIAPEIRNVGELQALEGKVSLLVGTEVSWSESSPFVFGKGSLFQTGRVEGGAGILLSSPEGSLRIEGAISGKGEITGEGIRIEISGPLILNSSAPVCLSAKEDLFIGSFLGNYDLGTMLLEAGGGVLIHSSPASSAQIFSQGGSVRLSGRNLSLQSCGAPAEIVSPSGSISLFISGDVWLAGGQECYADAAARLAGENISICADGNLFLQGGAGPQCLAEICAAGSFEAAIGGDLVLAGGESLDRSFACISAGESVSLNVKGRAKLVSGLGSSVQISARYGALSLSAGAIELRGNETAGFARIKGRGAVSLASLASMSIDRGEVFSKEGDLLFKAGQAIEAQRSRLASAKIAKWEAPRVVLQDTVSSVDP